MLQKDFYLWSNLFPSKCSAVKRRRFAAKVEFNDKDNTLKGRCNIVGQHEGRREVLNKRETQRRIAR